MSFPFCSIALSSTSYRSPVWKKFTCNSELKQTCWAFWNTPKIHYVWWIPRRTVFFASFRKNTLNMHKKNLKPVFLPNHHKPAWQQTITDSRFQLTAFDSYPSVSASSRHPATSVPRHRPAKKRPTVLPKCPKQAMISRFFHQSYRPVSLFFPPYLCVAGATVHSTAASPALTPWW